MAVQGTRELLRFIGVLVASWVLVWWIHARVLGPERPAHIRAYVSAYASVARTAADRSGVPPAIPLAVGGLESAWGSSELARRGNNHFGIKAHGAARTYCLTTTEYLRGRRYRMQDCFRAYDSPSDSYLDFVDFLRTQPRYAALFRLPPHDYKGWAEGLQACGYATDPAYASKLIQVIETYQLDTR